MPAEHPVDPRLLEAVTAAMTRSSAAALAASHEVLAHYSDTGDAPTQRAVDTMIDQAADALRALTDSLADFSDEPRTAPMRSAEGDGSSAHSVRRRDH